MQEKEQFPEAESPEAESALDLAEPEAHTEPEATEGDVPEAHTEPEAAEGEIAEGEVPEGEAAAEDLPPDNMPWYIIPTYSGFERKVSESLRTRADAFGFGDQIGQI